MRPALAQLQTLERDRIRRRNEQVRTSFDRHFACPVTPALSYDRPKAHANLRVCYDTLRNMSVEFGYVVLHPEFSFGQLRQALETTETQDVQRALHALREQLRHRKLEDRPAWLTNEDLERAFAPQLPF